MTPNQDPQAELRELEERLLAVGLTRGEQERLDALRSEADAAAAEEPTGIIWEQGPVESPAPPLPVIVTGGPVGPPTTETEPAGIPAPDPAFDAVVVPEPEAPVPELAAEEVVEILEERTGPPPVPPAAAVSWLDDEEPPGDVVSLDALLVAPPPASAEALAPPLPPPLPPHAPAAAPPAPAPAVPAERDPFAPPPSFVSGDHRVVLHTLEGQVLRGSIANADLNDPELPLLQPNGAVARVPADHVKAIFFMLPGGERPPPAAGTRVRVTFADGRQVSGLSPDYSPDSPGFFVLPVDARTNTSRVWVYRASVRQIAAG